MNEEFASCCFTGYRPYKFPFPFNQNNKEFIDMSNTIFTTLFDLANDNCFNFFCGMAMGFDILCGESVLALKKTFEDKALIKLTAVVPFKGQSKTFPDEWKKRYDRLLENADEAILMSDEYFSRCYQRRNELMVRMSDYVLTWYDGKPGGTRNTLNYAAGLGRAIINLNETNGDFTWK